MRQPIVGLVIMIAVVLLAFAWKQAYAATPNTLTMHFDSTVINVKGQNIPACRVQRNGAELVIPAPCDEVAAEVRAEICGNMRVDVDNKFECRLQPFTTFDFVIDGVHTGVI